MRGLSWGKWGLLALVVLGYLFVYLPMVTLIAFSFNGPADADSVRREWVYGTGQWHGFTLEWYERLLQDDELQEALWNSLSVAALTVLVSLLLGTMTSYVIYRRKFWGKGLFEQVLYIPLFMPGTVVGVSTLMLFRFVGMPRGFWAILAAHVAFTLPLVTLVILARMQRVNWSLEEAAQDLGASPFRALRSVVFPMLRPGIFAAGLLAFPWSFNDFVITFFLHGPRFDTLPIMIYSMAGRSGAVTPRVNALGTLVLMGSLLFITIGFMLQQRRRQSNA